MKVLTSLIFLFYASITLGQTLPVATWNYSQYNSTSFSKLVFNDSIIALIWPNQLFTYNLNSKNSLTIDQQNIGTSSYPFINKSTGNYYVKENILNGIKQQWIHFFSYKTLNVTRLNLPSRGNHPLVFFNTPETGDTVYVMINNRDNSFKIYKIYDTTFTDININLNVPIVGEFSVRNDTFVYELNYKGLIGTTRALFCKIGNNIRTIYQDNADSVDFSDLKFIGDKLYFKVTTSRTRVSQYYVSSFVHMDAKLTTFVPPSNSSDYKGEPMSDGTWRRINYALRRIERYDSTGLNLVRFKPFPDGFNIGPHDDSHPVLGLDLWVSISNDYGIEPCILNNDDSLVRFDITPGMFSSYENKFKVSDLSIAGDTGFAIVRNMVDMNHYLYRLNPKQTFSIEPIWNIGDDDIVNSIIAISSYRGKFYWLTLGHVNQQLRLHEIPFTQAPISVPKLMFDSNSLEWHRQIGLDQFAHRDNKLYNGGVDFNDSGDVIFSGFIQLYDIGFSKIFLLGYDNNMKHYAKGGQFTAKYGAKGNLQWITSYGVINDNIDRNFHQVVDKNGDVYVVGQAGSRAVFGIDTVRVNESNMTYLLKLNGKTGEILWNKILFTSRNTTDANVDFLTIDENNNLYLAIKYSNYSIQILNKRLTNDIAIAANALVKLNANGVLIWAVNTITPFTKYFGLTRSMVVNSNRNQLVMLQSVGYFNWWSSCKNSSWHSYVQSIDLESGILKWSKLFESDDLHSATTISLNHQGDVIMAGFFRGTITFDDFQFTSTIRGKCNQFQPFYTVLDAYSGKVLFSSTSETELFFPFDIKTSKMGDVWLVGAKEDLERKLYTLSVLEIDRFGTKVRERSLTKTGSPFGFSFLPRIDVNDDFVAVADMVTGKLDSFVNCNPYGSQLSILKFATSSIPKVSESQSPKFLATDYAIQLYPNPTNDYLTLVSEYSSQISAVSLFDVMGKEVITPVLFNPSLTYNLVDMRNIPAGVYYLKVEGSKGSQTIKVVKSD